MNRIVTLLQTPDRLVLSAVDAQGRAYEFQFVEFRYGGIGGGMGDYVVPLHSKATYSLKLGLDDFWLRDMTSSATQLLRGKSRITVHLRSQPRGLRARARRADPVITCGSTIWCRTRWSWKGDVPSRATRAVRALVKPAFCPIHRGHTPASPGSSGTHTDSVVGRRCAG
jgi:hypothetical protein